MFNGLELSFHRSRNTYVFKKNNEDNLLETRQMQIQIS